MLLLVRNMEYVPPPPIDASKVPMARFMLPNVPVLALLKPHKNAPSPVKTFPSGPAPKTKPCYGMARPIMATIDGTPLMFRGVG